MSYRKCALTAQVLLRAEIRAVLRNTTIMFAALKLAGVISWPWLVVFSPVLVPLAISIAYGIVALNLIILQRLAHACVRR